MFHFPRAADSRPYVPTENDMQTCYPIARKPALPAIAFPLSLRGRLRPWQSPPSHACHCEEAQRADVATEGSAFGAIRSLFANLSRIDSARIDFALALKEHQGGRPPQGVG